MFKILDGREQFYQWDLNRKLLVQDASITEVHFCNRTEECSLVVEVVDGIANVPNILLQDNFRIKVYGYDGEATKHSATFGIIARSKPADYIYTETDVKRFESLETRLAALEEGGGITELTKETFIDELDTGVYRINSVDFSYALWLDDTYCISLGNGIAIITWIAELEVYRWMVIGRDENWSVITQEGHTQYNSVDDYWEAVVYGEVENTFNKVSRFNELTISNHQYPTTKAVVDYVNSFEQIKEITISKSEKVYIQDLEPGFYVIHAPEGGAIVGGTSIHMTKGDSHLMASGDYTIATADAASITKFRKSYYLTYSVTSNGAGCVFGIFEADKSSGEWEYTKLDGGSFESNGNKCFVINDSVIADTKKYPSAKAVKNYVDSKLVPIELDVGGKHADNEYYNANTVDAVLMEVVGMVEAFEERISALENK